MIPGIGADLRSAVRTLRAAPVVTIAAALTLAMGIGATTAIFSVVNALMLRPLAVQDPERLVTVTSDTALGFGFQAGAGWSYSMWDELRRGAAAFDGAGAWTIQRLDFARGGEMQPADVLVASGGFFATLGVPAVVGRTFTPADDVRGGGPDGAVAVISHELWRRRFGGAATVVGTRLPVEGVPFTIIGVAPPGFSGVDVGQAFDIALPFGAEPLISGPRTLLDDQRALLLTVMLRLKPKQSLSEATAALRAMQPQIVGSLREAPRFLQEPFVLVRAATGITDRSRLRQRYERPLVLLSIISGLVLFVVCVNIANLLLARAAARRHDLGVQVALGAQATRVARQVLVEGFVLAGMGAVPGVIFAMWATRGLVALLPAPAGAVSLDVSIDVRVLVFTIGVTLAAVALFGTAPAIQATRVAATEALRETTRRAGGGRWGRLSGGLIVAQMAVSVALVGAAGLFVRTLDRLSSVPLGFEPRRVLVITVNTARSAIDPAARLELYARIVEAIAGVPGVTHAAGSQWTPLGGGGGGLLTDARGRRAEFDRRVAFNFVTPGWFETYGTTIRAGRDVDARDTAGAPRVALVNETLRRRVFADRLALGETIDAGPCGRSGCTVVGVVADAAYSGSLRDGVPPTMYLPLAQSGGLTPAGSTSFRVSVRGAVDPPLLVGSLAAALHDVDRALGFAFRPLAADVDAALAQERLIAVLAGFFGASALLLSGVGLYGVTAYAVTRLRGEIGVRLALGAMPGDVVRLVMRRVALLVGAGAAGGLAVSLWLAGYVAPLLYGLEPRDPFSLAVAVLTLAAIGMVAGWIPAARAARVDPMKILRDL